MRTFRDIERHLGLVPAAIGRQLSEIDVARGRQEAFAQQHPAFLETLKEIAVVQSVESSNAIERVTAPRKRIEALVAKKTTPRNRPEAEIAGYRDVLNTIHSSALHIPFEPSVVLQLHRDLYAFTGVPAGRWKGSDNMVVEELPGGETVIRFRPLGWFETPTAMDELHDRFNRAWEEHRHHRLLLTGAYVLDFLVIHPFLDGNGRMSRLLTLLLLYKAGFEVGRFVSLEKLIEDTKESYYDALAASTGGWHEETHDLTPWLSYWLGTLVAAYREFEERVGAISRGRGAKADLVRGFVRSHVGDEFTFDELRRAAPGVSEVYMREVLRQLKVEGAIAPLSRGRGARWTRLRTDI